MVWLSKAAQAGHLQHLATIVGFRIEVGNAGLIALAEAYQAGALPNLHYIDFNPSRIDIIDTAVLASHDPAKIFETALHGVSLYEGRVMFVGMGGVGKTWLHRRVFLDQIVPMDQPREETHDFDLVRVEACRWKPQIDVDGRREEIGPRVWDFGGQLILHGVHETFLSEDDRTVYLLVSAADRVPGLLRDYKGQEIGNGVVYWFKMISHFSGNNVPVIIAVTQCDRIEPGQARKIDEPLLSGTAKPLVEANPELLSEEFDIWVSDIIDQCSACDETRTIGPLRMAIESALSHLEAIRTRKVTKALIAIRNKVELELRSHALVTKRVFQQWCAEAGIIKGLDQDTYLRILHLMGSLFYFGRTWRESEELKSGFQERLASLPSGRLRIMQKEPSHILQTFIANPHWLKQAVYAVTRVADKSPWIGVEEIQSAVRGADQLCRTVRSSGGFTPHEAGFEFVREFMKVVDLSFFDESKHEYLFPRGLKTKTLLELFQRQWHKCGSRVSNGLLRPKSLSG